jgi:perosamine synthetase
VKHLSIHNTFIHPSATEEVSKVLASTFLSEGEVVKQFERSLEEQLGLKNCVTLNSGTAALHLALVIAGIKEGDEVIIPAQTFIATGLVVLQQKAIPVFADIDYNTGNISVESFRSKITPRTRAVIPVHWAGYPCDMMEINRIAKENNIVVIEDAAHALGATYNDKPIGTLSDLTCFSFQAIKHLTTGDGGAVCCATPALFEDAMTKRWFGINRDKAVKSEIGERAYNVSEFGFKYHLNNYAAALGLANLKGFDERLTARRKLADYYTSELSQVPGIQLFENKTDRESAWWLFGMHVEKRLGFMRRLHADDISASVVHQRIDRNSVFGGVRSDLVNQKKFDETQVHIPIHDDITMEDAERVVAVIKKGW